MTQESKWDVGEEVVTRKVGISTAKRFVASSAVNVVFGALMVINPFSTGQIGLTYVSTPHAVLETVRVVRSATRKSPQRSTSADGTDTQVGMSTRKLAEVFPRLFEPAPEEDVEDQFFFLS
jgi:hypothetical protein